MRFNPPPGWPQPPAGWVPPPGWKPDDAWPPMPAGWQLWLPDEDTTPPRPDSRVAATPDPAGALVPAQPTVPMPLAEPAMPTPVQQAPAAPPPPVTPSAPTANGSALLRRIAELEAALAQSGSNDVVDLNDQRVLQEVGIYRYHHPLEDAAAYKDRLSDINLRIDDLVKRKEAVLAADLFTFDGSLVVRVESS